MNSMHQDIVNYSAAQNKRLYKHNINTFYQAQQSLQHSNGFTLVELMVAMAVGTFIIIGIIGTYSSISASTQASKELENAQEVIRYSSNVFSRSLKQTTQPLVFADDNQTISVTQQANSLSCLGTRMGINYVETFTFVQPDLSCQIADLAGNEIAATTQILTGIANFQSGLNGDLFTLNITPTVLPENFGNNGVRIDIALTSKIISDNINAPQI